MTKIYLLLFYERLKFTFPLSKYIFLGIYSYFNLTISLFIWVIKHFWWNSNSNENIILEKYGKTILTLYLHFSAKETVVISSQREPFFE